MSLICPDCSRGTLTISASLELPTDSRSDEITLQVVHCSACGFAAATVYEESRRGALDDESFDHTGYRLSADSLRALEALLGSCATPYNRRCACPAHRWLGRQDASGRWAGLQGIEVAGVFAVKRAG